MRLIWLFVWLSIYFLNDLSRYLPLHCCICGPRATVWGIKKKLIWGVVNTREAQCEWCTQITRPLTLCVTDLRPMTVLHRRQSPFVIIEVRTRVARWPRSPKGVTRFNRKRVTGGDEELRTTGSWRCHIDPRRTCAPQGSNAVVPRQGRNKGVVRGAGAASSQPPSPGAALRSIAEPVNTPCTPSSSLWPEWRWSTQFEVLRRLHLPEPSKHFGTSV